MTALETAIALVGGEGPAAERVAAVVAERDDARRVCSWLGDALAAANAQRDDLRARLAAYESASVEASAETVAALRQVDCVAAGNGETLLMSEARAIRDHLRWLTTRYQREHVERERAERELAEVRGAYESTLRDRDAVLERIERALGDTCTGDLASDVERVVRVATAAERMMTASGATLHVEADELRAAIAAARERETAPQEMGAEALTDEGGAYCLACEGCGECPMTARLCTKCWGTGSAAEQPRADLGETDAGEGE
jgi:hypothetical protein